MRMPCGWLAVVIGMAGMLAQTATGADATRIVCGDDAKVIADLRDEAEPKRAVFDREWISVALYGGEPDYQPLFAYLDAQTAIVRRSEACRTSRAPLPVVDALRALGDFDEWGEAWEHAERRRHAEIAEVARLKLDEAEGAAAFASLARLRAKRGDAREADAYAQRARMLLQHDPGPAATTAIRAYSELATTELDAGRIAAAQELTMRTGARALATPDLSMETLIAVRELNRKMLDTYHPDEARKPAALPLLKQDLALLQRLGAGEDLIDFARARIVSHLARHERFDEVRGYQRERMDAAERSGRTLSWQYAKIIHGLAVTSAIHEGPAAALPYWRRMVDLRQQVFGPRHPQTALALEQLAALQAFAGDAAGAAQTRRERTALAVDARAKPIVDDKRLQQSAAEDLQQVLRSFEMAVSRDAQYRELDKAATDFTRALREQR